MSGSARPRFTTLQELCEMLGISRSRYQQLQRRGIFPCPQRTSSNRPVFDQTLVQQCLEVVRTRVGINGEPVLFNRKTAQEPSKKRATPAKNTHDDMVTALGSLGLSVTKDQVCTAINELPNKGQDMDSVALIKQLFLHLKRQR